MGASGVPYRTVVSLIIILALHVAQSAVVLRIRLPNGSMQRFEVDDEKETISGLREKLQSQGLLAAEDTSFMLKETSYSALSTVPTDVEEITIKNLGLRSGDILSIVRPVPAKEALDSSDAATSSAPRVQIKKVTKKKPTSIADLEKKRKELLKITRQKTSGGRSISMTSSAGRILNKIAGTGGYALLMGKIIKTTPEKKAPKKGNSIAAIAKLENAVKEKVEVHAVCEIFQYSAAESSATNVPPENLSDLSTVEIYSQIAKSMGLQIVGCCVGLPPPASTGKNIVLMILC